MTYSTVAIIYNPNSTGSSKTLAEQTKADILARLPKQKVELIATKHAGHAETIAYDIAKSSKNPLIISSSGDGGYHEIINGVVKAQHEGAHPITGLLPAGNANDHYHTLHGSDLTNAIANEATMQIDLLKLRGTVEGKPFERYGHSYIGFGFTPYIGKELNKNKLGIFNQVWIVGRALFAVRAVRLKIGKKAKLYDSLIFSNIDKMSKVLKISQPSRINNGKFEVTIFKKRNKLKLILLLLKSSLVGIKEDMSVESFSLETVRKTNVQIDGELRTLDALSKVEITIEKQVLRCIV